MSTEDVVMSELAPWHLIIVAIVILLVFGVKRIPELARSVGSGMREFRDGVTGAPETDPVEKAEAALPPAPRATDAPAPAESDPVAQHPPT